MYTRPIFLRFLLSTFIITAFVGCDSSPTLEDEIDFTATPNAAQTVPRVADQGVSGTATFQFINDGAALAYEITLSGLDLGGIKGLPQTADATDDVTKIHIHRAPQGEAGNHVLNIFGAPAEDDADMVFNAAAGTINGVWDNGDANDTLPLHAQSFALQDVIEAVCAGETYLNIHTANFDTGIIRGQILPTDSSSDICN